MSLFAKLQGDNLERTCEREVEELHQLFVSWFKGTKVRTELERELNARLGTDFSHVAPNGHCLLGRSSLMGQLDDKYACYKDRVFYIDIYNVKLLWHGPDQCLCTYEEWQSWQQLSGQQQPMGGLNSSNINNNSNHSSHLNNNSKHASNNGTSTSNDTSGGGGSQTPPMHQFGRLSTCLLERKKGGRFQWVHVHETWLEAEKPAHSPKRKAKKAAAIDDETILTGPVEPPTGPPLQLVVLISSLPLSNEQDKLQQRTAQILASQRIPYDEVDGADPEERGRRNELFGISKMWGKYPQFFVQSDPAETEYWGNFDKFLASFDKGTLKQDLGVTNLPPGPPTATIISNDKNQNDTVAPSTATDEDNIEKSASTAAPKSAISSRAIPAPSPPRSSTKPNTTKRHVIFLYDKSCATSDTVEKQSRAFVILEKSHAPYIKIDAADLKSMAQRDQLWKISGRSNIYPQIFLCETKKDDSDETTWYWGDYTALKHADDSGKWKENMEEAKPNSTATKTSNMLRPDSAPVVAASAKELTPVVVVKPVVIPAAFANKSVPPPPPPPIVSSKPSTVSTTADVALPKEEPSESPEEPPEKPRLLVLLSTQSLSLDQVSSQNQVAAVLASKRIPYDEVDGSDNEYRPRRNQLFQLSKQWGRYPLFFRVDRHQHQTLYWGDKEKFFESHERGTLLADLDISMTAPPPDEDESDEEQYDYEKDMETTGDTEASADVVEPVVDGQNVKNGDSSNQAQVGKETVEPVTETAPVRSLPNVAPVVKTSSDAPPPMQADDSEEYDDTEGEPEKDKFDEFLEFEPEEEVPAPEDVKKAVQPPQSEADAAFMEASQGILVFEEDSDDVEDSKEVKTPFKPNNVKEPDHATPAKATSPIPQDASNKRHVSPKFDKYAKPLLWEDAMVGVNIAGFDIGTSQGPIADEAWYKKTTEMLEEMAQSRSIPRPRRKIALPEMVFPTAHVALEGHGIWLSWDATDALEEWARAHHEIALYSTVAHNGVAVLKSKDAALWKHKHIKVDKVARDVFHYDWTYSTPFSGKAEGGDWVELDESGMRLELLTDQSIPILLYDEIVLFEDDMHDNGDVQLSIKLRVMPSCAYILVRLWVRLDNVLVRSRETRLLVDFFGLKPQVFKDVTWKECRWDELSKHGLPTDVRSWTTLNNHETPEWNGLVQRIPEVKLPRGMFAHAVFEVGRKQPQALDVDDGRG